MNGEDLLMMKLLAKMLSRKNNKSKEEDCCEQAIGSSYDISSVEYIEPLIKFMKNKK